MRTATEKKDSKRKVIELTLLEAEKFLRKIDEWNSVKHLNRELVIKWATFLKERETKKR
jgi:hypothetical protein